MWNLLFRQKACVCIVPNFLKPSPGGTKDSGSSINPLTTKFIFTSHLVFIPGVPLLPGDKIPVKGEHIIFDTSHTIDLDAVSLNGGFLSKTILLSPEPAMRERMRDPAIRSYTTTYIVGAPLIGFGLVLVLRSEKKGIKAGDYMYGLTTWEAYTIQPYIEGRVDYRAEDWPPFTFDMDSLALQVVQNPQGAFPLESYCSVLGTPGLTAFCGFEGLVDAKEGQTIFISAGASAIGSVIIQLAKAKGLKVITSVGTDAKVEYATSLGADLAFNYNIHPYLSILQSHTIDLCWDNVGGDALEAAIQVLVPHGTIICCGSSADYNLPVIDRYGIKNTTLIFRKRLILHGFIVSDLISKYMGRFFQEMPILLAQGKIKTREYITEGIENAIDVFLESLKRGNEILGKSVIVVARG